MSKNSRLAQSLLRNENEQSFQPQEDEFGQLKEEHKKLRAEHSECLKEIQILKEEISEIKTNNRVTNKDAENESNDEEILYNGKLNGFSREGPHSKPAAKSVFTCNVCKMKFRSQDQQQKHMEEHTTDGDWNCDDCAHQTNSSENLKKHMNNTHHKSQQIKDTSRQ